MIQAARWTAITALFAIPFLPLYVSNDLFFPFITGKGFAFRVLVEIAASAYLVLAVLDKRYRPQFSWLLVIFTGFVAWMAIANALGVNPEKAFWSNFERMDGWVTLAHVFALFVVAGSVLSVEKLWRKWWIYFLSVATMVCAYGVIQLMGLAEIHQGGVRVDASFGNAIYLAVYLMFSVLVAAWLAIAAKGMFRNALIGFCALATIILFYTASRGALIGLFAGAGSAAGLWLLLSRKEWMGKGGRGVRVAIGILLGLIALVGAFFLARDTAFVQNEPALARLSTLFSLSQELEVRMTLWGMALNGVAEDPVTGWGQEGFNQIFNKYYEPSLYEQEPWFDRVHNTYLDWLVAGGIPALALFAALICLSVLYALRAPGYGRAERAVVVGALIAYAVQAIVVFDNLFSYVPLVVLLAMVHAESSRPNKWLESLAEPSNAAPLVAGAGGVLAVIMVLMVNVPHMNAAGHLVYAITPRQDATESLGYFKAALADNSFASQEIREQLAQFAGSSVARQDIPDQIKEEIASFAVAEMAKEIEELPNDARLRMQYTLALEAAGQKEEALAQVEKAIELSPGKQVLYINYGYKLVDLARFEEAKAALMKAYELDPSFDEVAIASAAGLIMAKDIEGGKALLLEAVGTTTPHSPSLFFAYYQARQWNELIGVARAAVTASNGSAETRYRLAQSLAAAGRFNEARVEIEQTMEAHPETRQIGEALIKEIFRPAR
jgi:O-antigen ligase/Flp pilus assembly protein TadD